MATIPLLQAKNQFTQDLIAVLNVVPPQTNYLLDKFVFVYKPVTYLSWQVRRWTEVPATSVLRGASGNRVKGSGFTQKIEQAPFFHLYYNLNELEGYNAAFGTQNPAESAVDDLTEQAAFMYGEMKKMINRAYELQASQQLQTGIVLDSTTGNIDSKRNPASFTDVGSGNYWDTNTGADPFITLENMAVWLRQYGKVSGNVMDVTMGANVLRSFLKLTEVLARAQKLWNVLTPLEFPELKDDGSVFHGQVSAGPYKINIFSYPQYYTSSTEYQGIATINTIAGSISQAATSNSSTPFIADYNMVMTPQKPRFIFGSSMVPKIPKQVAAERDGDYGDMGEVEGGKFFAYDYQDMKLTAWEMNLKSTGLAILASVDEVVTAKVTSI